MFVVEYDREFAAANPKSAAHFLIAEAVNLLSQTQLSATHLSFQTSVDYEQWLIKEYRPLLPGPILCKLLAYNSLGTWRQAVKRKTVPIHIFKIPNRRGYIALTKDVADWYAMNGAKRAG